MIDHVSIAVRDLQAAAGAYEAALAPLGYNRLVDREATVAFGKRYPELWLNVRTTMADQSENSGYHVCLRARDEHAVREFHASALSNGFRDGGVPGPRQAAMTGYFGAFVIDPYGNRIEAASFPPSAG